MKKIITIGREYCSGGTSIGKLVAEILNVPFYDKEIIDMAAEQSGLSPDYIKQNDQSLNSSWLYTMLLGASYAAPGTSAARLGMGTQAQSLPLADQVFNAQRNVIVELAKKGPCVLVGRCSDYILRHCEEINRKDILNVFIYAPLAKKVEYAIKHKGHDPQTAEKEVKLVDKRRANHYNTFTERTWGKRDHYDLLIDSSLAGFEGTAQIIADIARR